MSEKINPVRCAEILIQKCLKLGMGDTFLLIYDESTVDFPDYFASATEKMGIFFTQYLVRQQDQNSDEAFTKELLGAINKAHGILVATTDEKKCSKFRIELTTNRRGDSSTVATMPGANYDILTTCIDVNYDEIIKNCVNLTLPLLKGTNCEIITLDNTGKSYSLKFELPGRRRFPIQSTGVIPRWAWGNVPAGETFVAPIENTAKGIYLVNGAIGSELIDDDSAILEFDNGKLVNHRYLKSGKSTVHLDELKTVAKNSGNESCWTVLAEFGIGVNPRIKKLTGIPLVDEKAYGTVHIAIGHNVGYGGLNNCPSVHCDITTLNATVKIDGIDIIKEGQHVYKVEKYYDNYLNYSDNQIDEIDWQNAKVLSVIEENYIENNGHLYIQHMTASGRYTSYPIGDENTSRLCCQVVKNLIDKPHSIQELSRIVRTEALYVKNILKILKWHQIIEIS